jgi:hypothetical protein
MTDFRTIVACAVLTMVLPTVAAATAPRRFVASYGVDSNPCTRVAPCRSFSAALVQTVDGGEVIALDSAGYGPVVITRPVTLGAPAGVYAAVTATASIPAVEIRQPGIAVTLRGLTLLNSGSGVLVTMTASVLVDRCEITGNSVAIVVRGEGSRVTVLDTTLRANNVGIQSHVPADIVVDRLFAEAIGLGAIDLFWPGNQLTVADSFIVGASYGVIVAEDGRFAMRNSVVAENGALGIESRSGGVVVDSLVYRNAPPTYDGYGIAAFGENGVPALTVARSVIAANSVFGLVASSAAPTAQLVAGDNLIVGNVQFGLSQRGNAQVFSRGNNTIHGNNAGGPQTQGTITVLAPL